MMDPAIGIQVLQKTADTNLFIQKIKQSIKPTNKLLIVVQDYSIRKEKYLTTLRAIAAEAFNVLQPKFKIQQIKEFIQNEHRTVFSYDVSLGDLEKNGVKVKQIILDPTQPELTNLNVYENGGAQLQILTIPLSRKLLGLEKQNENQEQLIKEIEMKYEPLLKKAKGSARKQLTDKKAKEIEAVNNSFSQNDDYLNEQSIIISSVIKSYIDQCKLWKAIVVSDSATSNDKGKLNIIQLNKKIHPSPLFIIDHVGGMQKSSKICGYYEIIQNAFKFVNFSLMDNITFQSGKNVTTKLAELRGGANKMQKSGSLTNDMNKLAMDIVQCIGGLLKDIYDKLKVKMSIFSEGPGSNRLISPESTKKSQKVDYCYFSEVQRSIGIYQEVKKQQQLTNYFIKKMDLTITYDLGAPMISQQLMPLQFLDNFITINEKFNTQMNTTFVKAFEEKNIKNNKQMLKMIKDHIKQCFDLIYAINESYVKANLTNSYCSDLQHCYEVLCFLFDSLQNHQQAAQADISIIGDLKTYFSSISPTKAKIIDYLVDLHHAGLIPKDQSTHYYTLLQKIIFNCKDKDEKVLSLNLQIKYLRQTQVCVKYSTDMNKIIKSVQEFCYIIEKKNLMDAKLKAAIDIFKLEKKVARLLRKLVRPDLAYPFYLKIDDYSLVLEAFAESVQLHGGDKKAQLYIEYGKILMKTNRFQHALNFFQKAYSCAENQTSRQMAKEFQGQSLQRKPIQNLKLGKYRKDKVFDDFVNMTKMDQAVFDKINKLKWDDEQEMAIEI